MELRRQRDVFRKDPGTSQGKLMCAPRSLREGHSGRHVVGVFYGWTCSAGVQLPAELCDRHAKQATI